MDVATWAGLAALVWTGMNFLKYVRSKDVNAIVTQAGVWVLGIGLVFLAANSDFAEKLDVNDTNLGALNGASLVLVGLALASTVSAAWDLRTGNRKPSLVSGEVPTPAPSTTTVVVNGGAVDGAVPEGGVVDQGHVDV